MALLDAVTNVANECGYSVDTVVATSTDTTTKQIFAIANRIIREMVQKKAWPALNARYSFPFVSGTANYALPGDFSSYHFDTFWNSTTRWRLLGPISEQQKAFIDGYGVDSTAYSQFQVRGITDTQLYITPTPTTTDTIIFEYLSDRGVRPKTWAAGQVISATGTYRFYNGVYYASSSTGTTASGATAGPAGDTGVTWAVYSGTYPTFLSDTDEPVLAQRILEQGMLERFAEFHGLPVVARFEDQLEEEFAKTYVGQTIYAADPPRGRTQNAWGGRVSFGGL